LSAAIFNLLSWPAESAHHEESREIVLAVLFAFILLVVLPLVIATLLYSPEYVQRRTIGQNVSHDLQKKIWKPTGMEFNGSWSLDSKESGFEQMQSGINARAIDFAKFGRLYLNNGSWNGSQVISVSWVVESTP
jgi:hypothetical protein